MEDNLQQVLEGYEKERIQLELGFLNQALVAATINDNCECIGKLIKLGAKNIDECIELAKVKDITNAFAMLILLKVALTGDKTMLFSYTRLATLPHGISKSNSKQPQGTLAVSNILLSGEVSTLIPLELAQHYGHHTVQRELLMLTGVNKSKGLVNWSKLNLISLDLRLLEWMYSWLREVKLTSNMLRSIPVEFKILATVRQSILIINVPS